MSADDGFLSRWARRKNQVRQGQPVEEVPVEADPGPAREPAPAALQTAPDPVPIAKPQAPVLPLPTLDDVAALGLDANYSRFVASGVDENVKRAALKKLFAEPQFNVMDGLDTYIDDYGLPDPLPAGMLRKMNQAWDLGLFGAEERPEVVALRAATPAQTSRAGTDTAAMQARDEAGAHTDAGAPAAAPSAELPHCEPEPIDPAGATPSTTQAPIDEDIDLQLQSNHATGRSGAESRAEQPPRRVDGGA